MSSRKEAILAAALPVLPILIPLGVHFVLVSFVFLYVGGTVWLPAYSFVHLILFLVGLWACQDKTSVIAAIALVVVIVFSGLTDIIQLGLYFPSFEEANGNGGSQGARTWQFSAAMCIFNLLFKPVSAALVCVGVYFRSGGRLPGVLGGGGAGGDSYNTIHGSDETNE
ncbi:uncharacterized protein LOC135334119 [Halichondria panicea]|uniref:uncharacterized protein LOC135334119 n=1 Tax=Halichondria panicea TaxID=6063 RepID=UPI00312B2F1C